MRPPVLSATLALALLACSAEENPTEPSARPNLARGAAKTYTAVDLGTFSAAEINPRHQVAGTINVVVGPPDDPENEDRAIIWNDGVITDLTGGFSFARAINPSGQVAGFIGNPENGTLAFMWDKGVTTSLGTLGGGFSDALDINAAGQVVGYSETAANTEHAFLWANGVMSELGTLGTGAFSEAFGINSAGQVVGLSTTAGFSTTHAFLWTHGVMTDLATLGGDFSVANAINSRGQVVGTSTIAPGQFQFHAFLWQDGVMTDLGTLGGVDGGAQDINSAGQVVGFFETADRGSPRVHLARRRHDRSECGREQCRELRVQHHPGGRCGRCFWGTRNALDAQVGRWGVLERFTA